MTLCNEYSLKIDSELKFINNFKKVNFFDELKK